MPIYRGSGGAGYGSTAKTPASEVSIVDAGGLITATDVEGALQENRTNINATVNNLASLVSGQGASLIGINDAGSIITATNVEGALQENRAATNTLISDLASVATGKGASLIGFDLTNQTVEAGATQQVNGVAALRGINPVATRQIYLAYHTSADDGGHGNFRALTGAAPGTYTDDNGITIVPTGGDGSSCWRRVYSGKVNARWFGLAESATTVVNDAALINAFAIGLPVYVPAGTYSIDKPITATTKLILIGDGSDKTIFLKATTTVGVGSNLARSGTVIDSYAKNAMLILKHADNGYNYSSNIKGVMLKSDGYVVEYGVYAPRTALFEMDDVYIYQCKYGVVAHDDWMTTFNKVICDGNTQRGLNGNNYGWAADSRGFYWQDDGSGNATGTTLTATSCWAKDVHIGWDMYGLKYSTLNGCGADHMSMSGYRFNVCDITMNGCGIEDVQLTTVSAIDLTSSNVVLNTCRSLAIDGSSGGTTAFLSVTGGDVTVNNCAFEDFATAGVSYNLIIQTGGKLVESGSTFPTNGNTFISYSSGASRINLSTNPPTVVSAESNKLIRYLQGRIRDNAIIESSNKAVLSAGTVIATLTAALSSSTEMASVRLFVTWYDTTFASGMGVSDVQIIVYQDGTGTNYRQAINTSVNVGAGNGFATAPAYTIARAGSVWSVTMTPSHGDLTIRTITAEVENYSGITVALP